ncbi:MAG TPA: hypothetical protein VKK31_03585 [Thermoanaerobaculia bacterium]|nr:hypothetical protein [Thermoanaerobaculia bacterium]
MAEPLMRRILEEPGEGSAALRLVRSSLPEALRSHVQSARALDREIKDAAGEGAFPTAVPAIDRLLDGGLPRGQLVELVGSRTSGRFSTLLAVLAAATSVGEAAALVDLGDGLDPDAALGAGVDLERFLWARPARLKEALAATEMLIAGGFPLVALDLGNPPVRGGRGVEAAWLRLARAARAHDSVLLVGSPYRVSGTAAGVVLKAGRVRAAWRGGAGSPWLLAGGASQIVLEKCRGRLHGQAEDLTLATAAVPRPEAPPALPGPKPQTRPREEERPAAVTPFLRRAAAG